MSYAIEKDWTTESGLRAVVLMNDLGHRCGYVGVGTDHALFGVDYSEQASMLAPNMERTIEKMSPIQVLLATGKPTDQLNTPEYVFEVHGGITYSGYGDGKYPVESNLWWFGYDCGHAGDLPAPDSELGKIYANVSMEGEHRTLDYCIAECESLASQLTKVRVL